MRSGGLFSVLFNTISLKLIYYDFVQLILILKLQCLELCFRYNMSPNQFEPKLLTFLKQPTIFQAQKQCSPLF